MGVTRRTVGHGSNNLVAVALVKAGGLERIAPQRDQPAAPCAGFVLGHPEEPGAVALATQVAVNPEQLDLTEARPGVPRDAGNDASLGMPGECGQQLSVVGPYRRHVEGVDLAVKELDLLLCGLVSE